MNFELAAISVASKFHEKKIGEKHQYNAMEKLTSTRTRAISFMGNTAKKRSGKYEVSQLTTLLETGKTAEETKERIMEFGEYLKIALTEKEINGSSEIHPFKQLFESEAPPGLVTYMSQMKDVDPYEKLKDMSISLEQMESMDQFYLDDYIINALTYCFGVEDIDFTKTDKEILAMGWKKFRGDYE